MTPLYRILTPVRDNTGHILSKEHPEFRAMLVDAAGAYTQEPPVRGVWQDAMGHPVKEQSIPYLVGCPAATFKRILAEAHRIFPDQASIFAMEVGTAFYSVPEKVEEAPTAFTPEPTPAFDDAYPLDGAGAAVPLVPGMPWSHKGGDVVGPFSPVENMPLTADEVLARANALEAYARPILRSADTMRFRLQAFRNARWADDKASVAYEKGQLQEAFAASFNTGEVPA